MINWTPLIIIINKQHVFRTKRSTVTNLAIFKQHIFDSFSSNSQTDVMYTDFEKAFEKVNYNLLVTEYSIVHSYVFFLNCEQNKVEFLLFSCL